MTIDNRQIIGLGDVNAGFKVYIGNWPDMPEYQNITGIHPIDGEQIRAIGQCCGNGWRKVFNVYAKLLFEWYSSQSTAVLFDDWQSLRNKQLLQEQSNSALVYGLPSITEADDSIHIICGRTHAKPLIDTLNFIWLDKDFAIYQPLKIIISPYFDYRQLSNVKIQTLVRLIHHCQT